MKRIIKILFLAVAIATLSPFDGEFGGGIVFAQKEMRHVIRGNRDYRHEQFDKAELNYRRGIDANGQSFAAEYNLGNALFRQEKYPEAAEAFARSLRHLDEEKAADASRMADAYHNLGNALFAQQQYDKAVQAYAMSLRKRPEDNDTRYNLAKAIDLLKQQQQQQNENQNENQNKDQQQQQQQEQQQNQNENQDENQQQEQQQQQQDESKMDKETAEQLLQALEQDEQETQEKMQRVQGSKKRVEKNW